MRNEGTNMVVRVGVGRRRPRVIAPARADPFDAANNLRADRQQRWLLPGFFYRVSNSTQFSIRVSTASRVAVLRSLSEETRFQFEMVWNESRRTYWVLLGLNGFEWVLLGFTGFYWVLLGYLRFHWVSLGL